MDIMRGLAKSGTSIVFITHKLREVKAIADKITVIRQGRVVGDAMPSAELKELASMMVGRDVGLTVEKNLANPGKVVLGVSRISVLDDRNQRAVNQVSFEVRAGEILAIAGVQGNGQTELAEAILGLRSLLPDSGELTISGTSIKGKSVRSILEKGVGYVPEDRRKNGLISEFTVAENLMLNGSFSKPFANGLGIAFATRDRIADERIKEFDVRTPSSQASVGKLSGGNQQKVVLARELSRKVDLLIVSQPTRGVDVGSIEFIHERLIDERNKGKAVLLISSELEEVLALADRIAVMYRGQIVGIVEAKTDRAKLGQMMAGVAI
jgi:simple sugar transport system ATP-binding protein